MDGNPEPLPQPEPPTEALSPRDKALTLTGILLALFLGALDQTIVATSLPRIVESLRGVDRYAWVATAYLLASTVLVPVYGKLADLFSRKVLELVAIGLFLGGSFLCGLAGEFGRLPLIGDGMSQLIAFRALQGIGGAGLFALAFIIIADLFPPAERGRYQGLVGGVFGLASVLGPLAGGVLTDYGSAIVPGIAGWRWVFYVNLPFGILALWFVAARLPPLRPAGERAPLSFPSLVLLVGGFTALILALELDKVRYPWASPTILGLFAAAALLLGLFVPVVLHARNPILDLRLFRDRVFATAIPALFFLGMAFLCIVVYLPLFMINVVGVSATQSGVSLIPVSLGLVAGSVLSGQLVTRYGRYRLMLIIGDAVFLAGMLLLSWMDPGTPYPLITVFMLVCGLGLGPSFPVYTLAIQNSVDFREIGQATSASQFFRQIGGTVGVAVMGTVLATMLGASFVSLGTDPVGPPGGGAGTRRPAGAPPDSAQIDLRTRAEFGRQYALIERAVHGDREALRQVRADPRVPPALKAELDRLAAGPALREPVVERALAVIRAQMNGLAGETVRAAEREVRQAYAEAVTRIFFYCLFMILAALAITFFVPERVLRKTNAPPPPGA